MNGAADAREVLGLGFTRLDAFLVLTSTGVPAKFL
jgi:hypothetical protein